MPLPHQSQPQLDRVRTGQVTHDLVIGNVHTKDKDTEGELRDYLLKRALNIIFAPRSRKKVENEHYALPDRSLWLKDFRLGSGSGRTKSSRQRGSRRTRPS